MPPSGDRSNAVITMVIGQSPRLAVMVRSQGPALRWELIAECRRSLPGSWPIGCRGWRRPVQCDDGTSEAIRVLLGRVVPGRELPVVDQSREMAGVGRP